MYQKPTRNTKKKAAPAASPLFALVSRCAASWRAEYPVTLASVDKNPILFILVDCKIKLRGYAQAQEIGEAFPGQESRGTDAKISLQKLR